MALEAPSSAIGMPTPTGSGDAFRNQVQQFTPSPCVIELQTTSLEQKIRLHVNTLCRFTAKSTWETWYMVPPSSTVVMTGSCWHHYRQLTVDSTHSPRLRLSIDHMANLSGRDLRVFVAFAILASCCAVSHPSATPATEDANDADTLFHFK